MSGLDIIATGRYAPKQVVTNEMMTEYVDTNDEWITKRTGIKQRHFVQTENTTELALEAVKDALSKCQIDQDKIGYIIVATFTPEHFTPSTACLIQRDLGLPEEVLALDINAACSGFLYGLKVVHSLLSQDSDKYAILVGSEVISKFLNFSDRGTCVLFGDGAGAAILKLNEQKDFYFNSGSKGDDVALICRGMPLPSENHPMQVEMDGKEVFKFAVDALSRSIDRMLEETKLNLEEIDYVICHQANIRIISHVYKKLKVSPDKFCINIQEYGNTSAASIPILLDEMNEKKMLKRGMRLLLVGFGAGFTWGASLIQW